MKKKLKQFVRNVMTEVIGPEFAATRQEINTLQDRLETQQKNSEQGLRDEIETLRCQLEEKAGATEKRDQGILAEIEKAQTMARGAKNAAVAIKADIMPVRANVRSVQKSIPELQEEQEYLRRQVNMLRKQTEGISRINNEILWSQIFHDTIKTSKWLQDKAFVAGRYAVGYPFLYVLYRTLEAATPAEILEIGLGQSTNMIAQFAASHEVSHLVIEGDQVWYDFFMRDNDNMSKHTHVQMLEYTMVPFQDVEAVRVYKDFTEASGGRKYNLICVDAPFGGDMERYSRVDILSILPQALADSFVILFDDVHREGEKNTCLLLEEMLVQQNIAFSSRIYEGENDFMLYCSEDLRFLCTL